MQRLFSTLAALGFSACADLNSRIPSSYAYALIQEIDVQAYRRAGGASPTKHPGRGSINFDAPPCGLCHRLRFPPASLHPRLLRIARNHAEPPWTPPPSDRSASNPYHWGVHHYAATTRAEVWPSASREFCASSFSIPVAITRSNLLRTISPRAVDGRAANNRLTNFHTSAPDYRTAAANPSPDGLSSAYRQRRRPAWPRTTLHPAFELAARRFDASDTYRPR